MMFKKTKSSSRAPLEINKIFFLIIGCVFLALVIIARLFQLQVIEHNKYQQIATREQYGFIELPAQRGEILIKDYHSSEEFLLATNTTLNLLYADPFMIKNPTLVGQTLAPIIFDLEEERAKEKEEIEEKAKNFPADITEEERNKILTPSTDEELRAKYEQNLINTLSQKRRSEIILTSNGKFENIAKLRALNLSGIKIKDKTVYAYPLEISNIKDLASKIADFVEIPEKRLEQILKGENRYVVLKRKLPPQASDKIKAIKAKDRKEKKDEFLGIGMQEQYFRFYPEGSLAANIVGYVSGANIGQYGIESSLDGKLKGIAGQLQTKRDSIGRQITVGESVLVPPKDGDDVVLTIDRSIQMKVDQILEEETKFHQADSGQAIVMNPKTGAILAISHYPTFNPNTFNDVFKKVEINLTPEEIEQLVPAKEKGVFYFYTNPLLSDRYMVFEQKDENGRVRYYRYENFVGPEVYLNKAVSWPYEPGSVFKSIVMAGAIDDGDITPNTTYNDVGPIGVDWNVYRQAYDFEIKNSTGHYGLVDMTTVLAKSLNTGMTFIAKKMGPALLYSYLDKFGFLSRTDIEFDSEGVGKVAYFENWTESELATKAFGQGMTVTLLQIANAYSAIANGGILMQPHIVDEVRSADGTVTKTEPHEIRRVISEDTANKVKAMLVQVTERGEGSYGKVPGHYIAGKTGTSQTYKFGRALSGKGTTIASFAGFAPINDPQFVIVVKYDRPRRSEWGSGTAAFTFEKIASYLFEYYNIPPDKEA